MIILLEPVCSSWIHEEVNAGFLQLVRNNSNDEVLYIGEKEHVCCVRKIYADSQVKYKVIIRQASWQGSDSYENTIYYFILMFSVIMKCKPNILFILCGYRPCILAAEMVSFLFPYIKINFIIHGMIEKYKGNSSSYERLFKIATFCKRLRFVTYNPFCTDNYWGVKRKKFFFLHHPYVKDRSQAIRKERINTGVTIGIIGACANAKALKLISMVNRCKVEGDYEFLVISRFGNHFRHLKNVKVLDITFDREKKTRLMRNMDYLLLPYDRQEYTLSASGVLWDAISNHVPCLMLDCKYFEYYMPYKIGYRAKNIKELCEIVCEKIQCGREENEKFFMDLEKIEQERNRAIRQMLLK